MSITPWYTVWCDGCIQWQEHGGHTRKEAWDNARKIGSWKLVKGQHLCPDCQAKLIGEIDVSMGSGIKESISSSDTKDKAE